MRDKRAPDIAGRHARTPDRIDARFTLLFLERPLHLRRDQMDAIERIFADDYPAVRTLRYRMEPELTAVRHARQARFRALLDERQRAQYDRVLVQLERYGSPRQTTPP